MSSRRKRVRFLGAGIGLVGAALLLALLLRGIEFKGWPTQREAFPVTHGLVHRVIDGDTIELSNGMRIRYIGVDAPELRHRVKGRWVYNPEYLAEEAKLFNERMVQGKRIRLEYDQELKDRFGRHLAYVFTGDLFVNAELIRLGYARVLLIAPNLKHSDLLLRLEREATNQRKGIWGRETLPPGHEPCRSGAITSLGSAADGSPVRGDSRARAVLGRAVIRG